MSSSTLAIACLIMLFACLSFYYYYSLKAAYILVAFESDMVLGLYGFKTLWVEMAKDWIAGTVIVLTARFTIPLPAIQLLLQSPSLYIFTLIFGVPVVAVLRARLPQTLESVSGGDH
jgi:hypothetical protein